MEFKGINPVFRDVKVDWQAIKQTMEFCRRRGNFRVDAHGFGTRMNELFDVVLGHEKIERFCLLDVEMTCICAPKSNQMGFGTECLSQIPGNGTDISAA